MPESVFWCFLVNFAKLIRSRFAEQHRTTVSEYSSINSSAGSTVLANETVNYDTKAKAYLLIEVRSVSY